MRGLERRSALRCILEFCDGLLIFPKPRAPTGELEKIRASLPYKPLGFRREIREEA